MIAVRKGVRISKLKVSPVNITVSFGWNRLRVAFLQHVQLRPWLAQILPEYHKRSWEWGRCEVGKTKTTQCLQCERAMSSAFRNLTLQSSREAGQSVDLYKKPRFQGNRRQTLPRKQSLELKEFLCQGQLELLCQTCSLFPGSMKNEILEGGRRSLSCVHNELGTT